MEVGCPVHSMILDVADHLLTSFVYFHELEFTYQFVIDK